MVETRSRVEGLFRWLCEREPGAPARGQRWLGVSGLVLFSSQFAALELWLRADAVYEAAPERLLLLASSVGIWALLALSCEGRLARALLALVAGSLIVVELIFYRHYHVFLGDDAVACARRMWPDVKPVVVDIAPWAAAGALLLAGVEYLSLSLTPKSSRRARLVLLSSSLAAFALAPAPHDGPPDLAALRSLRAFARPPEARAAGNVEVPRLDTSKPQLPNVLFILSESVRARDYFSSALRETASESLALVPNRVELREMRSVASYTAIAVNALLSGHVPLGSREQIAKTPLLFDYLRALRLGGLRPSVNYWSAQGDSFFERKDLKTVLDSLAFVDDVVGRKVETLTEVVELGVDGLLADRVAHELPRTAHPVFAFVHLSGTHAPYYVDPAHAPFHPYRHSVAWSGLGELHNAYLNALVAQDQSVARMLRSFLDAVGSEPYLIVFTSDHGEAFGEHDAIHHGQNLYDEQTHVPAWIGWGNGALDPEQARLLSSHRDEILTHLDLLPTLLDAYGALDSFGMISQKHALRGRSLLRAFSSEAPILPITNCTMLFPCPLKNYGVLGDGHALTAQPWDGGWRCVDLLHGDEQRPLGSPACRKLELASKSYYELLPNGRANR